MEEIGHLRKAGERYEFHYPELGLVVRGPYAEWVLEAAGEIVSRTERLRAEGRLEELRALTEFGEADPIEIDSAEFDVNARFEAIPQCLVSMGALDYHWMSRDGREDAEHDRPIRRIYDTSRTRNDSFLANPPDADG